MAAVLLVVVGIAQVLSGDLTLDPGSPSASSLHESLGLAPVFGIPLAALLMASALKGKRRTASLGIGVLLVLMIGTFIVLMAAGTDVSIGLFQRLYIGVMSVWIVMVGLWLRAGARQPFT